MSSPTQQATSTRNHIRSGRGTRRINRGLPEQRRTRRLQVTQDCGSGKFGVQSDSHAVGAASVAKPCADKRPPVWLGTFGFRISARRGAERGEAGDRSLTSGRWQETSGAGQIADAKALLDAGNIDQAARLTRSRERLDERPSIRC